MDLITTGNYRLVRVQSAPDIVNGKLRVLAHVANSSATTGNISVSYEVREAITNTVVGTKVTSISLAANAEVDVENIVTIANPHLWTQEDPFLYKLTVSTANDTFTTKVGMRTFEFDPITHKPMVNGKIYMLRGTNFCM